MKRFVEELILLNRSLHTRVFVSPRGSLTRSFVAAAPRLLSAEEKGTRPVSARSPSQSSTKSVTGKVARVSSSSSRLLLEYLGIQAGQGEREGRVRVKSVFFVVLFEAVSVPVDKKLFSSFVPRISCPTERHSCL